MIKTKTENTHIVLKNIRRQIMNTHCPSIVFDVKKMLNINKIMLGYLVDIWIENI